MMRRLILASAFVLGACAPGAPANWARGGAMLDVPRARWVVGSSVVDVHPNGRVTINDSEELTVDRGGRVYDPNNEPVALLEPGGKLVGPGDKLLGNVGILHASQGDEPHAWLSVLPTGEVVRYEGDGSRSSLGVWIGCNQNYLQHQTCTLVSHLLTPRIIARTQNMNGYMPRGLGWGPGYMPGMGFGMPWR
ncbi:hypothetical protein [Polyangium spumosum]|uniref:Uncharacterized protein n=1 Tax=Polyangium spumosum TaxID=889282 RepID=A0A6N7PX96_9BACT|nr:hypothetical protein [Polyangium spumosum]MRG94714.1 hypothetical protein [Polyangium spumosum]